jgi:hypothetical protein
MALYAPEALFVANDGRTITDRRVHGRLHQRLPHQRQRT